MAGKARCCSLCSLHRVRLQPPSRAAAASAACGCSLHGMRLQPPRHAAARLQPPAYAVAGALRPVGALGPSQQGHQVRRDQALDADQPGLTRRRRHHRLRPVQRAATRPKRALPCPDPSSCPARLAAARTNGRLSFKKPRPLAHGLPSRPESTALAAQTPKTQRPLYPLYGSRSTARPDVAERLVFGPPGTARVGRRRRGSRRADERVLAVRVAGARARRLSAGHWAQGMRCEPGMATGRERGHGATGHWRRCL